MPLIDWTSLFRPETAIEVSYSSLSVPESRDSIDDDIAQLIVNGNTVIDIEWDDSKKRYIITAFNDDYDNKLAQVNCKTPVNVVEIVKTIVDDLSDPFQSSTRSTHIDELTFSNA